MMRAKTTRPLSERDNRLDGGERFEEEKWLRYDSDDYLPNLHSMGVLGFLFFGHKGKWAIPPAD